MQIRNIEFQKLKFIKPPAPIFEEDTLDSLSEPNLESLIPIFLQNSPEGTIIWFGETLLKKLQRGWVIIFSQREKLTAILATIAAFIRYRRPLYPAEIARVVSLLTRSCSSTTLPKYFAKITGQKYCADWQQYACKILALHPELRSFLVKHKAPLKTYLLLTEWSAAEQDLLSDLFKHCAPTLSQSEIINRLLLDTCKIYKTNLGDLLDRRGIRATITQSALPITERASFLIQQLRQLRFPAISAQEKEIEQVKQRLPGSTKVQLTWDTTFETRELHLHFTMRDKRDLAILKDYSKDENLALLAKLLDLL